MATPTTLPATFVAGNVLTAAQMNDLRGAFRVLQIVQTVKTDTFSTTSSSYTDVTGLTVSITPSSTSSKILVLADVKIGGVIAAGAGPTIQLVRDSTAVYIGDAASNRTRASFGFNNEATNDRGIFASTNTYLDSPNTTSATTYKIQMRAGTGGTARVNATGLDTDTAAFPRTASSITVMEISA